MFLQYQAMVVTKIIKSLEDMLSKDHNDPRSVYEQYKAKSIQMNYGIFRVAALSPIDQFNHIILLKVRLKNFYCHFPSQ